MDVDAALTCYYELREQYRRRTPRKMPAAKLAEHRAQMVAYLDWCRATGILDPLGFMAKRFALIVRGSRRRSFPRISQLASGPTGQRWKNGMEDRLIAAASYERRKAELDEWALLVKSLAAAPHPSKERLKLRWEPCPEVCLQQFPLTGGYDPRSPTCQRCPQAAPCTEQLTREHGFDVAALRAGRLFDLPSRVVSALVR